MVLSITERQRSLTNCFTSKHRIEDRKKRRQGKNRTLATLVAEKHVKFLRFSELRTSLGQSLGSLPAAPNLSHGLPTIRPAFLAAPRRKSYSACQRRAHFLAGVAAAGWGVSRQRLSLKAAQRGPPVKAGVRRILGPPGFARHCTFGPENKARVAGSARWRTKPARGYSGRARKNSAPPFCFVISTWEIPPLQR